MKIEVEPDDPRTTPLTAELHAVPETPVAKFGAAIQGSKNVAGGNMTLSLLVPFEQVMNAMPVMQYVGGVVFEITVKRVPMDQLPEPGW